MSKQTPSLSKEYQVLLKLLRLAIGTEPILYFGEPVEPFPDDIDWKEVIRLSYEQKVSALAVDGLKSTKYTIPDQQTQELFDNWIHDVDKIEKEYIYYQQVIQALCQLFAANNLKAIILKGIGLGQNYQIPSHRGAGDIDIVVLDENNKFATEKAFDFIINSLKLPITEEPHHYRFEFKGIEVELHYDITNAYWNLESEYYLVRRLNQLLLQDYREFTNVEGAYLPSPTFNALFLMRHMFGHFYTSSGKLRQYIDWILFIRQHYNDIDWKLIEEEYNKSGMKLFADGIITMLIKQLGTSRCEYPSFQENHQVENIYFKDILNPKHRRRIQYFYSNRAKLKLLTGKSWFTMMIQSK